MKARAAITAYAASKRKLPNTYYKTENNEYSGDWILRSPGKEKGNIAKVQTDGSLGDTLAVFTEYIRPAFWLDLSFVPELINE